MESWNGYNYYTRNTTRWVELMNLSTTEWDIGPLPANVVAIRGTLDDGHSFNKFPNNTIVIEKASKADIGHRGIEKVVFGVTSGVVLLWAAAFWIYNRKSMFNPRGSSNTARSKSPLSNTATIVGENEYITAEQFKGELERFYYPPTKTELEEYEKDARAEPITAEDVEAVTDLLRKMYDLDLGLWSHENSTYVSERVRDEYRDKSDAVLAEIRRIVTSWNERQSRRRWSPDELEELKAIVQQLALIPPKRYDAQSRQE